MREDSEIREDEPAGLFSRDTFVMLIHNGKLVTQHPEAESPESTSEETPPLESL